MKGGKSILALLAVLVLLATVSPRAQDTYQIPIKRVTTTDTVLPVLDAVVHNKIVYTFGTNITLSVRFETVDVTHVRLTVKPATPVNYTFAFTVQWGAFPSNLLEGGGGSSSFILNTETGYAEK